MVKLAQIVTKRTLPTLFIALFASSQASAQLPVIRGSGAQNAGSIQNSNRLVSDAFSYPFGYGDCTEFRWLDYRVTSDMLDPKYLDSNDIPIHTGEDWNRRVEAGGGGDNDLGDPVCSIGDGVVTSTGSYPTWSNVIVIRHDMPDGSTRWSQYAHLSEVSVSEGPIRRGQMIGRIGKQFPEIACNTTTGEYCAHLHFEIRQKNVDPWNWPRDPNIIERQYLDPTDVESDDGMPETSGFIETHQSTDIPHSSPDEWTVTLRGIGPVRLGMTIAEAELASGYRFQANRDCNAYYIGPSGYGIDFRVYESRIVSIEVRYSETIRSDRGIGTGSSFLDVQRAYGRDRLSTGPPPHSFRTGTGQFSVHYKPPHSIGQEHGMLFYFDSDNELYFFAVGTQWGLNHLRDCFDWLDFVYPSHSGQNTLVIRGRDNQPIQVRDFLALPWTTPFDEDPPFSQFYYISPRSRKPWIIV